MSNFMTVKDENDIKTSANLDLINQCTTSFWQRNWSQFFVTV